MSGMRLRKLIGSFVAASLALGALPFFADTVRADDYDLFIDGVQVTSTNTSGSGWSYKASTNTLTLNGFDYYVGDSNDACIDYRGDKPFTIVLEGDNSIEGFPTGINVGAWGTPGGAITIEGTGSLLIDGAENGIECHAPLTIKEGTYDLYGDTFAINCDNLLTISGGDLTITTGCDGINAYSLVISGGDIKVTGGEANAIQIPPSADVEGYSLVISGGTVEAIGTGDVYSAGIYCGGNVNISGGTVIATGKTSGIQAEVYDAEWNSSSADVIIGDCTLVATAVGTADDNAAIIGNVKNSIAGTGWTDSDGTKGKSTIAINKSGASLGYMKVQFGVAANPSATLTKTPAAKTGLKTTGSAQALITAGTAVGGTLKYAVGNNGTTAPTSGWSTTIPTGKNAGTYYVWYFVDADDSHEDTDPVCLTVKIEAASTTDNPTDKPTGNPTDKPTGNPTDKPTDKPTGKPTGNPTDKPTGNPTDKPTGNPTTAPSGNPTSGPSSSPTYATGAIEPTDAPTTGPSGSPSGNPTDVPTDIPTGTPSREVGVAGFVERLYSVALGRPSDPNGKAEWIDAIMSGRNTGADAARGFLYSTEFTKKGLSDEEFLRVLYRTFFDREADEGGLNAWLGVLAGGESRENVIDGFINSTEWANLCLDFGILSGGTGVPTHHANPSQGTIDFCTRLYTTCLKRDADQNGLMAWAQVLADQKETGTGAAHGFFFSKEFTDQNVSNAEYLTRLYNTFMDRDPDEGGFNAWLSQLDSGVSREEVFQGFAQSTEFGKICQSYGIRR